MRCKGGGLKKYEERGKQPVDTPRVQDNFNLDLEPEEVFEDQEHRHKRWKEKVLRRKMNKGRTTIHKQIEGYSNDPLAVRNKGEDPTDIEWQPDVGGDSDDSRVDSDIDQSTDVDANTDTNAAKSDSDTPRHNADAEADADVDVDVDVDPDANAKGDTNVARAEPDTSPRGADADAEADADEGVTTAPPTLPHTRISTLNTKATAATVATRPKRKVQLPSKYKDYYLPGHNKHRRVS
ncbi:hypothetical protein Pelo_9476 [Pelomyxa schiedti]|nr:hypothetical protein Pelo_9476 [Pelomyxa schiedti]